MHEFSLASDLIAHCERLAGGRRVTSVRVRRNTDLGQDELRLAFEACAVGTVVEGARLDIDVDAPAIECRCGFSGVLGPDDVVAHIAACPACGEPIAGSVGADLVLLALGTDTTQRSP